MNHNIGNCEAPKVLKLPPLNKAPWPAVSRAHGECGVVLSPVGFALVRQVHLAESRGSFVTQALEVYHRHTHMHVCIHAYAYMCTFVHIEMCTVS